MNIKEKLKKIKPLRKIVRWLKSEIEPFVFWVQKNKSLYYLKKIKKSKKVVSDKIKIGFIVQDASVWDKQVELYGKMRTDSRFEVFMFVVPEEDFYTYEINNDYKNNYFTTKYPEAINALKDDNKCIDLFEYELNYVFYQRPYNYRIPKELSNTRLVKKIKCCYIPYGFTASDTYRATEIDNPFYDSQYFVFQSSKYMQTQMIKKYLKTVKKNIQHIEYLGYPALARYIRMQNEKGYCISWTPRGSFDKDLQSGNFLKYKEQFLNTVVQNTNLNFIFRPHPNMYTILNANNMLSDDEWEQFLNACINKNVIYDMAQPIDEMLNDTAILITDHSTIIGTFFMTGRPIIYCDMNADFNPVFQEMMQYVYIASSWDDVDSILTELLKGNDRMKNKRLEFVKNNYNMASNATTEIMECIYRDAMCINN